MDRNHIERVHAQPLRVDYLDNAETPESHHAPGPNVVRGLLRRWHIVLIVFVLFAGVTVPLAWVTIEPQYHATSAIRVAPIIPAILFSDQESEGVIPMYSNFMNTQAQLIGSDPVLQRAADELNRQELSFFEHTDLVTTVFHKLHLPHWIAEKLHIPLKPGQRLEPVVALRQAIQDRKILIAPERQSELIFVTVEYSNPDEARAITDAIVNAYMEVEGYKSAQSGDRQIAALEEERRTLAERIERQRETIRQMAEEYGTVALTGRQDMMLQRVAALQQELTRIEAQRMAFEVKLDVLENTEEQERPIPGLFERRQQFINNDLSLAALNQRVTQIEQDLLAAEQIMTANNPELQRQRNLLQAFHSRIEQRREELSQTFDETIRNELSQSGADELTQTNAELRQLIAHEESLRRKLIEENSETIALGRKQLDIQELQDQLALSEDLYETVRRRICELQVEQKRPARISVSYDATAVQLPDRRKRLAVALPAAGLAAGFCLAFLLARKDQRVRSPEEIMQVLGVPVLGTTVSTSEVNRKRLPQRLANDYQGIRTNLGLRSDGEVPHTIAITSAGVAEGKTTLAINLAISLAQGGSRVLLLDGDFHRPDVARVLRISENTGGVPDVLLGIRPLPDAVTPGPVHGLDVLVGHSHNTEAATELLSRSGGIAAFERIAAGYDHVIVDTPPVLASPIALVWARVTGSVVLSTLAGRTEHPELRTALERLREIDVQIIGNVLGNVSFRHSYQRYGYGDGYGADHPRSSRQRPLLMSHDSRKSKVAGTSSA